MIDNVLYYFLRVAVISFYSKCIDNLSQSYYSDLVKNYSLQDILDCVEKLYLSYRK